MTSRLFLFLALTVSVNAFAAAGEDKNCYVNEDQKLTEPWIMRCAGDVIIREGVTIYTGKHDFIIRTDGTVKYGSVAKPAVVKCLEDGESTAVLGNQRCGRIYAETHNLDGGLRLDCTAADGKSCQADIVTGAYSATYHQTMNAGSASFFLSGDLPEPKTNVRWTN